MKPATTTLLNFINAARASNDVALAMADAFAITLANGNSLYYTNSDVTFTYGGHSYLGNNILISGLKYKAAVGLEVDSQQITIAARQTDTITGGAEFLAALREGSFDGASIVRYRVFFSASPISTANIVGGVLLFKGLLGKIDEIGRTTAKLTVNSDLILLDNYMPRNIYQATCVHTLYDSGCTLTKASFGHNGTVGAGSTASAIHWSGATTNFQQGTITFTSGVNDGVSATVGTAIAGILTLIYPLETTPSVGDAFTVYYGCDHTQATCTNKFANQANFRAFPFVPPPSMAL